MQRVNPYNGCACPAIIVLFSSPCGCDQDTLVSRSTAMLSGTFVPLLDHLYQLISHHSTTLMQTASELRVQVN